jgi:hypothetical protein
MKQFLLQLFILDNQGKPSHTKLFSVCGYLVLLFLFPYAVIMGSKIGYEFWLVALVTLIGNRSLNKFAELKNKG